MQPSAIHRGKLFPFANVYRRCPASCRVPSKSRNKHLQLPGTQLAHHPAGGRVRRSNGPPNSVSGGVWRVCHGTLLVLLRSTCDRVALERGGNPVRLYVESEWALRYVHEFRWPHRACTSASLSSHRGDESAALPMHLVGCRVRVLGCQRVCRESW